MNMLLRPNLTAEEFEDLSNTEGMELIDGSPEEIEVGSESSFVGGRVFTLLAAAGAGRLGLLFPADTGYICFPHRPRLVRKPDVSFVRNGRFPHNRPPRGFARLVPDLAVEVISPNDTYYEVDDRLNDYLLVGVPLVWIVNPDRRTVLTYTPDGTIRRLTAEQELTGEPLFPDFRVRVADLFPEPLPEPPPEATPPATA
jgi:Uma2 family endonuclease